MKDKNKIKNEKRDKRRGRIRVKVKGTAECPRLSVFKSNKGMYLQLIDDSKSITLVSVNNKEIKKIENSSDKKLKGKIAIAFEMGKKITEKAKEKNITKIVFDRGGYKYHGRVSAVADGARKEGLIF